MPNSLIRYWKRARLPLLLIVLFVVQNRLFNYWLNIYGRDYLGRQTAVTFALGVAFFGPAVLLNRRYRYVYLGCMSALTALILLSQYLYFSYSGGFLQASALLYSGLAVSIAGTIKTLLTPRASLFLVGPVFVVAAFVLSWKHPGEVLWSRKEKLVATGLMIALSVSGYAFLFHQESKEIVNSVHLFGSTRLYNVDVLVGRTGVVNYYLQDLAGFAFRNRQATPEDLKLVEDWKHRQPEEAVASARDKTFGLAKGRNLIFIQVESLENLLLNKKIGDQEITPRLNQLAKEGLYFTNYYTQIGPGNTADAEFTTLNSLYPLPDEVAFIGHAYNNYQALPQTLKASGYQAYAFHGDVPSFWNRANIYPRLGYAGWFSRQDYIIPRSVGFGDLGDDDFLQQSLSKMQALPQPFMATLITLSSHTPFELPADLQKLSVPQDSGLNQTQRNYLISVNYTDAAIGNFIDKLKQAGLYDNSLIVIFGDHGSFTDISDILGDKNDTSPIGLRKGHIPLIVLAPGTGLKGMNATPASHLDLYPTVCALLGVQPPANLLGQDVLATKQPLVVNRNLVSGSIQTILTATSTYDASADGVFENGKCLDNATAKRLPTDECRPMFERESETVAVSDIVVRNNLLGLLEEPKAQVSRASGLAQK